MSIEIPESCLVLLMGASGAGKTTFAARHFLPTEVLSSDALRAWICDDPTDQSATGDAFEVLHDIAGRRLARMRLTVIDATNVHEHARQPLLELARRHHTPVVVIALLVEPELCASRNVARTARSVPEDIVHEHHAALEHSLARLRESRQITLVELAGVPAIEAARIERVPLAPDRRDDRGPFDIIGDVHGCLDELRELLSRLGYHTARHVEPDGTPRWTVEPPPGRRLLFVGDIVDRGPHSAEALRLVMDAVDDQVALVVPGNHDVKLMRRLQGRDIKLAHGLAETMDQIEAEPPAFAERARTFIEGLAAHLVLDEGRLVVAHAGLEAHLHGRVSKRARAFALFGKTTGARDAFGLPVRLDWAADYRGDARVVYGHTPSQRARWVNGTICIDTGCCFGHRLTALRYPELELDAVAAHQTWGELKAPMRDSAEPAVARSHEDALAALDEALERLLADGVDTRHDGVVRCDPRAARRVAERLASGETVDLRWLVALPPLVPSLGYVADAAAVSARAAHATARALAPVVAHGVGSGRRALVVVVREASVASDRFGVVPAAQGAVIGRAAGRVLDEAATGELVTCCREALTAADLWTALQSDRVVLDGHLDVDEDDAAGPTRFVPQRILASASGVHAGFEDAWHRRLLARLARCEPRLGPVALDAAARLWWMPDPLERRAGVPYALAVERREASGELEALPSDGRRQRGRAVRSTALALEALARFAAGAPTAEVLVCVLGQLAVLDEAMP